MSIGIVTDHLIGLIAKQVNDSGLVVWYDPDGAYEAALPALNLPDTEVLRYQGSFVKLRWEIDQKHLMDGEQPPRLVVYVPMAQDQTYHALIVKGSALDSSWVSKHLMQYEIKSFDRGALCERA